MPGLFVIAFMSHHFIFLLSTSSPPKSSTSADYYYCWGDAGDKKVITIHVRDMFSDLSYYSSLKKGKKNFTDTQEKCANCVTFALFWKDQTREMCWQQTRFNNHVFEIQFTRREDGERHKKSYYMHWRRDNINTRMQSGSQKAAKNYRIKSSPPYLSTLIDFFVLRCKLLLQPLFCGKVTWICLEKWRFVPSITWNCANLSDWIER